MSGRPYARNACAPYMGPRDLEAILPHTFSLEVPARVLDAKHEAIRSAIHRRCMQKNWRKLISIRRCRRIGDFAAEGAREASKNEMKQAQQTKDTEGEEDTVGAAKEQLQELELKLQGLTDQKHAKFQLLKDILVEEARSKTTGSGATASLTTQRRDVWKFRSLIRCSVQRKCKRQIL
ncbi:unnamed protein product [Peronospora destructor]|uniref:Uncharacterized protein n=1 Tax=Peronospora destructor TaxID=86335 RepID=A0AAV0USF2_9STRA|nr:unnamed protein product [Peronospora destructor]